MSVFTLLITPPFTQLNTPYPATCYLKGFLNTKNYSSFQIDLGIETILAIFNSEFFKTIFSTQFEHKISSENAQLILANQQQYIETIDEVILFLQNKNNAFEKNILDDDCLPKAKRFKHIEANNQLFATQSRHDQAVHFATLYLEDIADFITECVDEHFGFSRYAERLGRSANSFDEIDYYLQQPISFIENKMLQLLHQTIEKTKPQFICFSVPFPGNLLSTFRCGQYIKKHFPDIKIAMGGGFANTELRGLQEKRVFNYVDFITLDDGETPIENLLEYIQGKRPIEMLKRTFVLHENEVKYMNGSLQNDYLLMNAGTPDYSDLLLDKYISVLEIINPMHRLWSEGFWNKLTLAHGCYWRKCTFCDVSLNYIQDYQQSNVLVIVERIEQLIAQNNCTQFHFVDEAAPPALLKLLAIELIKRKIKITWWTNIRFEKSFTNDLCYLLQKSGCIAVSGGLEVASNRLLQLINKGVSVEQVAIVLKNFKQNNILVHAYLMYGYPTQTEQETIDSLEIVRQLFLNDILQSAYWHQFALTVHSPIAKNPNAYKIAITSQQGTFANNDLEFEEEKYIDHNRFSFGLKKSLYNFMQHNCLGNELQYWFDFDIDSTTLDEHFITKLIEEPTLKNIQSSTVFYWLEKIPSITYYTKSKKGKQWKMATLTFENASQIVELSLNEAQAMWLLQTLPLLTLENKYTYLQLQQLFESQVEEDDFELFWHNKIMNNLATKGLVCF